jgi:predicted permease
MWLEAVARLAPTATVASAESELRGIARRLARQYPETNAERGIAVAPGIGFDPQTRGEVQAFTTILLGVVALVLLIACANVANLLLARASARQRELSVRSSLGASRARLVRQMLAEGLLLATLGGLAGLLLGAWTASRLARMSLIAANGMQIDTTPDVRVLAFTAAVALLSTIVFGLPAAFVASRVSLVASLKAGAPGSGGGRGSMRNTLLVGQLALSLVLLVAAGLFVRTLGRLYAVNPGFETEHVLVATTDVALQGYDEARGRRFYTELERRAAALPGVRGATLAYMLPLGGGGWDTRVFPAERAAAPQDAGLKSDVNTVSASYFGALGLRHVRGRGFTDADRDGAPPVAVVNEAFARALWPGEDAIGKRYRAGRTGDPVEIVGVVRTAKYRSLLEPPRPFLYRPFGQVYQAPMTLHLATDGDPRALVGAVRRLVEGLDPDLPTYRIATLRDRLDGSIGVQRAAATLVGAYGMLALLVAAVGLYGSMAYTVARRSREIGIRRARGARAPAVLGQVLREAGRLAALGVLIGMLVALPAGRLLRSQLFGVSPSDPVTLVVVGLVLGAVSLAAAYVPARRATRVDPVLALRVE